MTGEDQRGDSAAPGGGHLSTLVLDALALDSLDAVARGRAEDHLRTCARCRAESGALRARREQFTATVLPRTLPAIAERTSPRRWRHLIWLAAPALAAAMTLILLRPGARVVDDIGPGHAGDRLGELGGELGDDLRIKGGPSLQVVARRGEQVVPVVDGTTLAAGDQIRFVIGVPRRGYLLIASVDGSGATTVYYPYGGSHSAPVEPGPRIELPASIVLDDAPGPERIVALWSSTPLAAGDVTARLAAIGARGPGAIRSTDRIEVTADAQRSVVFEKSTAP